MPICLVCIQASTCACLRFESVISKCFGRNDEPDQIKTSPIDVHDKKRYFLPLLFMSFFSVLWWALRLRFGCFWFRSLAYLFGYRDMYEHCCHNVTAWMARLTAVTVPLKLSSYRAQRLPVPFHALPLRIHAGRRMCGWDGTALHIYTYSDIAPYSSTLYARAVAAAHDTVCTRHPMHGMHSLLLLSLLLLLPLAAIQRIAYDNAFALWPSIDLYSVCARHIILYAS